jgi:hypothetical protein
VLRRAEQLLAALAVLIAVPVGLLAAAAAPAPSPVATGVIAGLGTLAACWSLLGLAGALWRSRLAARDARETAREWARVEPFWSRRTISDAADPDAGPGTGPPPHRR